MSRSRGNSSSRRQSPSSQWSQLADGSASADESEIEDVNLDYTSSNLITARNINVSNVRLDRATLNSIEELENAMLEK
jgi:hypothetical protein